MPARGRPLAALALLLWLLPPEARSDDAPAAPDVPVGEVAITATRVERPLLATPGNLTVIDRAAIERSGARDVPDLLRREAGIFVTNTTSNPEGYSVEARGFLNGGGNGSGTLVLVNGRRINEPSSSVVDWSLVRIDQIERIEVLRGPASALYGDNAMAGVIHIVTRSGEGPPEVELRGRTGTYDSDAGSVFAGGSAGAVSGSLFADGIKTDGYRERSDFRARQVEAQLRVAVGEHALLGLTTGYTSQLRKRPGDLSKAELAADRRQAEPGDDRNSDRVKRRFADGLLELYLPGSVTLQLRPYFQRRTDDAAVADPDTSFVVETESDVAGLNTHLEWESELFGRPQRLLLGVDLLQEDTDSDSLFEGFGSLVPQSTRSRRKLAGVFLQQELELMPKLLLAYGVRRERVRTRGRSRGVTVAAGEIVRDPALLEATFRSKQSAWGPRASLTYRIAEPLSVYASYARGFRFPNLDEAFGFFGFSPGLDPQKSDAYEVGLKLRSGRVSANLAAYTMNVQDEILLDPFAPNPFLPSITGVNVNLDRVRHRGLEAQLSLRPLAWLELHGSYTFDDARITRDAISGLEGQRMPITPRHRGSAGVRAELARWLEIGVDANYVGARFLANDLRNAFEKLPKYARYDAEIRLRPPRLRGVDATFTLAVRNLTNRRYTEFGGVSLFAIPGQDPRGFFPAPDRHYELGAVLRWGG